MSRHRHPRAHAPSRHGAEARRPAADLPTFERAAPSRWQAAVDASPRHARAARDVAPIQRYLDGNQKWRENDEDPVGIPARRRRKAGVEVTRDGGQTWEPWQGEEIDPATVSVWPRGTGPVPAKTDPGVHRTTAPAKQITDYKPYDREALARSSLEHIGSFLSPEDRGSLAGATASIPDSIFAKAARAMVASLSPVEVMAMREISKTSKALADELIWGMMQVHGLSSFDATKLGAQMKQAVTVGAGFLRMAADQVDLKVVASMLEQEPALQKVIQIRYGQSLTGQSPKAAVPAANVAEAKGPTDDKSSKMHNKFVVMGSAPTEETPESRAETVVTGSSNATWSGQNRNTESMIVLRNPVVAAYFNQFFDLLSNRATRDSPEGRKFAEILERHNDEDRKVRMAMAPFMNLNDFVKAELDGADTVVVRMFVVSLFGKDNAVEALCTLAKSKQAAVTVVVDQGQHKTASYVREAVKALRKAGATVKLQSSPEGGIMHDKMILAHHPATRDAPERHTVVVGSSGFTRNVYEGMNYENMIAVDDRALYDYFMQQHHLESLREKAH